MKSCAGASGTALDAVCEREERHLLALQELLDDDAVAEGPRLLPGCLGFGLRSADEDALAGGEPVRFDDAGCVYRSQLGRGRNARRVHDLLGERLRPLDARGLGARAEDRDPGAAQVVRDARDERGLGADHDEVELVLPAEPEQALDVVHPNGMAARERSDARVSGGGVQLCECVALRELPRERVLSAARADDQDLHPRESSNGSRVV